MAAASHLYATASPGVNGGGAVAAEVDPQGDARHADIGESVLSLGGRRSVPVKVTDVGRTVERRAGVRKRGRGGGGLQERGRGENDGTDVAAPPEGRVEAAAIGEADRSPTGDDRGGAGLCGDAAPAKSGSGGAVFDWYATCAPRALTVRKLLFALFVEAVYKCPLPERHEDTQRCAPDSVVWALLQQLVIVAQHGGKFPTHWTYPQNYPCLRHTVSGLSGAAQRLLAYDTATHTECVLKASVHLASTATRPDICRPSRLRVVRTDDGVELIMGENAEVTPADLINLTATVTMAVMGDDVEAATRPPFMEVGTTPILICPLGRGTWEKLWALSLYLQAADENNDMRDWPGAVATFLCTPPTSARSLHLVLGAVTTMLIARSPLFRCSAPARAKVTDIRRMYRHSATSPPLPLEIMLSARDSLNVIMTQDSLTGTTKSHIRHVACQAVVVLHRMWCSETAIAPPRQSPDWTDARPQLEWFFSKTRRMYFSDRTDNGAELPVELVLLNNHGCIPLPVPTPSWVAPWVQVAVLIVLRDVVDSVATLEEWADTWFDNACLCQFDMLVGMRLAGLTPRSPPPTEATLEATLEKLRRECVSPHACGTDSDVD